MKTISIFGKNMPIIAILMALLVIGTASAAVFANYATLRGNVEVTSDIKVEGVEIGKTGILDFDSPATFVIKNEGDTPVIVGLVSNVTYANGSVPENYQGMGVELSVIESENPIESGLVLVPPGGLTVNVTFIEAINLMPDDYTIQVDVNPYTDDETYLTFTGNNSIETINLSYKDSAWQLIDKGYITVDYVPMGNNFTYRLTSDGVDLTDYALIYYADYPNRFVEYGGDNPGFVINDDVDISDGGVILGSIDVGMNMPHVDDANYDTTYTNYCTSPDNYDHCCGAKLWLIPRLHLTDNVSLPMDTWDGSLELYMFETDLMQYIDTDL